MEVQWCSVERKVCSQATTGWKLSHVILTLSIINRLPDRWLFKTVNSSQQSEAGMWLCSELLLLETDRPAVPPLDTSSTGFSFLPFPCNNSHNHLAMVTIQWNNTVTNLLINSLALQIQHCETYVRYSYISTHPVDIWLIFSVEFCHDQFLSRHVSNSLNITRSSREVRLQVNPLNGDKIDDRV